MYNKSVEKLAKFFGYEYNGEHKRIHKAVRKPGESHWYSFGSLLQETEKWCAENNYDISLDFDTVFEEWSFLCSNSENTYQGQGGTINEAIEEALIVNN